MFCSVSINFFIILDYCCVTTYCFNSFERTLRECISFNVNFCFQFTVSKNFNKFLTIGQTSGNELCDSDLGDVLFLSDFLQSGEVNSEIFLVVDILETSLWNTTLQRHLTTFETNLSLITRSCLGTLMATSRSTTET